MIEQSKLFKSKSTCCGCELCAMVCKHNVIEMKPDKSGFLYPNVINKDACIGCNLCVRVCPEKVSYKPFQEIQKGYGGYCNDDSEVKKSASGGFSFAIGHKFISDGGVVYGVRYSDNYYSACYDRAQTINELERFRTSKYVQAKKTDIYARVKCDLINKKKVLFVGLPCEVSALYNFLKKDYENLYAISLLCHGVTSPSVQAQFCAQLEDFEKQKITGFSVRHKVNGWKPYFVKAEFDKGARYLRKFVATDYEVAFKYLKRPSCSSCVFKLSNKEFGFKADLIIGDFHGARCDQPYYNKWGASKLFVLSDKGEQMKQWADDYMYLAPISIDSINNGAPVLNIPTRKLIFCDIFRIIFENKGLHIAANNRLVLFASKWMQPLSKRTHAIIQRIQVKLIKRIIVW